MWLPDSAICQAGIKAITRRFYTSRKLYIVLSEDQKSYSSDIPQLEIYEKYRFWYSSKQRIDTINVTPTLFDTGRLHLIDSFEVKPSKAFVWVPVSEKNLHWVSQRCRRVTSNPPEDLDSVLKSDLNGISIL